jgi:hypothetical protein
MGVGSNGSTIPSSSTGCSKQGGFEQGVKLFKVIKRVMWISSGAVIFAD